MWQGYRHGRIQGGSCESEPPTFGVTPKLSSLKREKTSCASAQVCRAQNFLKSCIHPWVIPSTLTFNLYRLTFYLRYKAGSSITYYLSIELYSSMVYGRGTSYGSLCKGLPMCVARIHSDKWCGFSPTSDLDKLPLSMTDDL